MGLTREQADLLRSIAKDIQSQLTLCKRGLLNQDEAADSIRKVWTQLLASVDPGSVEWRVFDKGSKQTMWWRKTHDGYVDASGCDHFEAVYGAIDSALALGTGRGLKDYRQLLEQAQTLKNIVVVRATSMTGDDPGYRAARSALMADEEAAALLPQFVRTARNLAEIWAQMSSVAEGSGAYALRREYIRTEFDPLLTALEVKGSSGIEPPHSALVTDALEAFGADAVRKLWDKALGRIDADPEGALTVARSLIESVSKHILDAEGQQYADSADAPALVKQVLKLISVAPGPDDDQPFKQIASGCVSVATGVSAIANEYGDRHGSDSDSTPAGRHHVELVINLAGSLAMFLVEAHSSKSD